MARRDDELARISGNAVADLLLASEDERNDLMQAAIEPLSDEESFVVAGQMISQLCDIVDALTIRPDFQADLVVALARIKDRLAEPPQA